MADNETDPGRVRISGPLCRVPPSSDQSGPGLCSDDQHLRVRKDFLPESEPRARPAEPVNKEHPQQG